MSVTHTSRTSNDYLSCFLSILREAITDFAAPGGGGAEGKPDPVKNRTFISLPCLRQEPNDNLDEFKQSFFVCNPFRSVPRFKDNRII